MPKIVLVHGRDYQFFNPGSVLQEWKPALEWGLERAGAKNYENLSASVAFYGDLWLADAHEEPERALESFGGTTEKISAFEEAITNEFLEKYGVQVETEAAVEADEEEEEVLESYNSGPRNWLVRGFALLEKTLPIPINRAILSKVTKDVEQYLYTESLRQEVIERVAGKIRKANDEVVLIAHSLGTVVSYDVLLHNPDLPVKNYISLASPLGYKIVRNVVAGDIANPFPSQLERWVNVYNLEDIVCAQNELAALYPSGDSRKIEDVDAGEGRRPGLREPFAAHDARVYMHSIAFGRKLKSILEE